MRKLALAFIFVFVIIVGSAVFFGVFMWVRITEPYRGYSDTELYVQVPAGAGTGEIGRALVDAGIVHDQLSFRAALYWTGTVASAPVTRNSRTKTSAPWGTTTVWMWPGASEKKSPAR